MTDPYKVGLTGGIGCGKSLVSEMFAELGVPVIDADEIVHELLIPGSPLVDEIIQLFGGKITDNSGGLARDKLRALIFSDNDSRKKLEAMIHPHVFARIDKKIKEISAPYCILSIPLLLETNAQSMVDTVLVVDCPVSLQIDRVSRRDGISREDVEKIIGSQIPRDKRLDAADEVIRNEGTITELRNSVSDLHEKYSRIAESANKIV